MRVVRSRFFVPAVLFTLATAAITIDDDGVRWMWREQPWIAIVIGVVAVTMWVLVGIDRRSQGSAR